MLVLVCTLLTAIVFAHAQNAVVTIDEFNNVGVDNYIFRYQTSDGTKREEEGKFVGDVWTVKGMFSWIGPDGVTYRTRFVSDDKGYRVLPGSPPQEIFIASVAPSTGAALLGIGK